MNSFFVADGVVDRHPSSERGPREIANLADRRRTGYCGLELIVLLVCPRPPKTAPEMVQALCNDIALRNRVISLKFISHPRFLMSVLDLLPVLQQLPKADKLRLVQFLIAELVREEAIDPITLAGKYPIWSPYNAFQAAEILLNLLSTRAN